MTSISSQANGLPTLELETPRGNRRWCFAYDDEGPRLVEGPGEHSYEAWPAWVEEAATGWWRVMRDAQREIAADQDLLKAFRGMIDHNVKLAGRLLSYKLPGSRENVRTIANELHRIATRPATPTDMADLALDGAHRLSELLRRLDPTNGLKQATYETRAKIAMEGVLQIVKGGKLGPEAVHWATQIRDCAVWAGRTSCYLDSQIGRMEMGGSFGGHEDPMPSTKAPPMDIAANLPRYHRWKENACRLPWWHDPKRDQGQPETALRSQSSASYWSVCQQTIVDGRSLQDTDAILHLPFGRAAYILPIALSNYGQA